MKDDYGLFRRSGAKVWYFWYYEGHKRITKSTGKTLKKDAKEFVEDYIKQDRPKEITLVDYAKDFFSWDACEWIKRQHSKGRAFSKVVARGRRSHLTNYIFPMFGHVFLHELNPVKIENWLLGLNLSNQSKNHILYSFNIVMREAKREKIIKSNPIDDIEALSRQPKKTDALSLEELKRLFPDDIPALLAIWGKLEYAAMMRLMASSGIRLGETRALTWSNIAWERSAIFILQAFKAGGELGPPKANEKRAIFIPDACLDLLREWQRQAVFTAPDALVFYGEAPDRPLNNKTVYNAFMAGLKNAGIDMEGRNLKPHSLRHTYNTIMRNILPETTLREFTGHRSESMTDHYDSRAFLAERLDKLENSKKLINEVF